MILLLFLSPQPGWATLNVEIFVPAQGIFDATGNAVVSVNSLARGYEGTLYAFDSVSRGILQVSPAGVVSTFLSEASIVGVTGAGQATIAALTVDAAGDLFAADVAVGILRIPTQGPSRGIPALLVTNDAIIAAAAVDRIAITSLAVEGDKLFAASATGSLGSPIKGLRGIVRVPTAGPSTGVPSLFLNNDDITAVTGSIQAALNALATGDEELLAADAGTGGSRGLLRISDLDAPTGTVETCASEQAMKDAIEAATGSAPDRVALTALAVDGAGSLLAADTGDGGSNSILALPTAGAEACQVSLLVAEAGLLAETGAADIEVTAEAAGSLFAYDGVTDSLLSIDTADPGAGNVDTFVPNAGFFAATGNTASLGSLVVNGGLLGSEGQTRSLLRVPTSGADAGTVGIAVTEAGLAAVTGEAQALPGPLVYNAASGDSFLWETVSQDILRVSGGATVSSFLTKEEILDDTKGERVDILAMATNSDGFLLALNGTDGIDETEEDAGVLRIRLSDGKVFFQCSAADLVKDVAKELGLDSDEVTVEVATAAMNSADELFTYDAENQILLRLPTSSSACKAELFVPAADLIAATGGATVDLSALAMDDGDNLFAYDDDSSAVLAIPTAGADAGVVQVVVQRAQLLAATGRADVELSALSAVPPAAELLAFEDSRLFAFDEVSDGILRLFGGGLPGSDLGVSNTDSPDPVSTGALLTYSVGVTNSGPEPATSVELIDTLPAGVSLVSASPTQGSCAESSGVVTCALGTIGGGSTETATIIVNAPLVPGTITNIASATSASEDPNPANNTDIRADTEVVEAFGADVRVEKSDAPDPVSTGGSLTYSIEVANDGPETATGVDLTDRLPADTGFVSADVTQGSCAESGGVVTCSIGEIANGAAVVATIVVTAPDVPGSITNKASASATSDDRNPGNNTDIVELTQVVNSQLDHFLCYQAKGTKGAEKFDPDPFNPVDLDDQFEDKGYELKSRDGLCNPVDKNSEGIRDEETHLLGYRILELKEEEKHAKRTGIQVNNQLGELRVDTVKPERLLVPAAKDLSAPVDPPVAGNHQVDHFKCYKVKLSKGADGLPDDLQVSLQDQFTELQQPAPVLYDVKKPTRLCTPVDKNDEGVSDKNGMHLMCYQIKRAKGESKAAKVIGIHVNDQFGPGQVDSVKEKELCVPSHKTLAP